MRLEAAGFLIHESPIPTIDNIHIPNIVAWHEDKASVVIDVQIMAYAAAGDLYDTHHRKT